MAEGDPDQYAVNLDARLEECTDTDDVFSPANSPEAVPVGPANGLSPEGPDLPGCDLPDGAEPRSGSLVKEAMTRTESTHSNLSQVSNVTGTSGDTSEGPSPLLAAIEDFDVKAVEVLLKNGAEVKDISDHGTNAGHHLMRSYCKLHPADQVEAKPKFMSLLQMLVSHGLDLNVGESKKRQTPLHIAAGSPSNSDVIKPLLASGSKVNQQDAQQRTALHYAVAIGDEDNVNALIEGGANPNLQDNLCQTVLHLAAKGRRNLSLVQFLLSCGAEANISDISEKTPLHIAAKAAKADIVKELLNYGAQVNSIDSSGQTAMHLAAVYDITGRSLHELLSRPADVNVQEKIQGHTALHKAVQLQVLDNIKVLAKARADPNRQDTLGETALHSAYNIKEFSIWQQLMRLGGDVHMRNQNGHTALFKALKANNGVALAVMRQYGVAE